MSQVYMKDVLQFIGNKSFEELQAQSSVNDILIKEKKNGTHDNLYLVTYEKEGNEAPLQFQCNGVILEKNTNKIIVAAQNKVHDVSREDMCAIIKQYHSNTDTLSLESDNKNVRVEYCEDGTMIRLYSYNNVWYTATNRCIDARDSHWSSNKTFDEMFWEVFDKSLLTCLDTSCTYVFILLHRENRIVVKHNYDTLVYVCKINNSNLQEDYRNIDDFKNTKCIWRPKFIPLLNMEEFDKYYYPAKRGILIKLFNIDKKSWDTYKVDFDTFTTIKNVRGNVPQIRMRFLELLHDSTSLVLLEKYYPEYNFLFAVIKHSIMNLTKTIHQLYIESHVKHAVRVDEENPYFKTLKQLHSHYKTHNTPITHAIVEEKLLNLDKHILKRFLGWVH